MSEFLEPFSMTVPMSEIQQYSALQQLHKSVKSLVLLPLNMGHLKPLYSVAGD